MIRGTYSYTVLNHSEPYYTKHRLHVEVLGETAKSYLVKYLSFHHNGTAPGYKTWVRKRKVLIHYGHHN